MTPLRHIMIMASAGSGKTYALTNRFVELLARGAPPERIVALTFTRKAAGEFFDEILRKLARAAGEPEYAAKLAAEIEVPTLRCADFLRLLRAMIDASPRLKLGTLDSFFARIARAFPLELGLSGEFEILQEHAATLERQRVLARMFTRATEQLAAAQLEFVEAFKRATFGLEEKQLRLRLDAFLDAHQETYLRAPSAAAWGDPRQIWPRGSPWLELNIKLTDEIRALKEALGPMSEGQRGRWEIFFAALEQWTLPGSLPAPAEYLLKNTLDVWPDVGAGAAEITVERKRMLLSRSACSALGKIVTYIVGAELQRRLERTRGIYAVVRGYEANYHEAVRRLGRLTFGDIQRLLDPSAGAPALAASRQVPSIREQVPGADPSRLDLELGTWHLEPGADAGASERRLALDYRLDAEIDHWLLDEFQDTSFGQWSVLRNLVDEVVQDPERRRSFFCVGDVKQAIYAWREGDARLFREVFDHYNQAAAGTIEEKQLSASWRSGPAPIAMVNAVFGSADTLAELFPGDASAMWNAEWRRHVSAVPERNGHAALLHAEDELGRWDATRAILAEIQPCARGLTCAVLVKRNDTAAALAEFLRRAGIAATAESDLHVAVDNPLGAALLALVQAAAHPGDTLAQEHIQMTPLADTLRRAGLNTPEIVTRQLLTQIHAFGFERTMRTWIDRIESHLAPDDRFSRHRAAQFVAAARLFDATGSRSCDEFIAFLQRHTVRAPDAGAVVRVMTIHKAKGLGFDVVVVPDLQGNRIDEARDGLAIRKAADRSVEWILDLPPRLYCEHDDVLAEFVRGAEADACYENLSLLYVALTRAKRALYVVTEPVRKSKSRNFPRLLAETLGGDAGPVSLGGTVFTGSWQSGDANWYATLEEKSPGVPLPAKIASLPSESGGAGRRLSRVQPSAGIGRPLVAAKLFALERGVRAEFGSALHALLAEVPWKTAEWPKLVAAWRDRGMPVALLETAVAVVEAPALAAVWDRPRPRAALWRERAFDIVLDGAWVSGVCDRVVVEYTAEGRVRAATIYDFKTDAVPGEVDLLAAAQPHLHQLSLYRRVVAVLLGVEPEKVAVEIVFTERRQRIPLPSS